MIITTSLCYKVLGFRKKVVFPKKNISFRCKGKHLDWKQIWFYRYGSTVAVSISRKVKHEHNGNSNSVKVVPRLKSTSQVTFMLWFALFYWFSGFVCLLACLLSINVFLYFNHFASQNNSFSCSSGYIYPEDTQKKDVSLGKKSPHKTIIKYTHGCLCDH